MTSDDDTPWTCIKCGYVEVGPKACGNCGYKEQRHSICLSRREFTALMWGFGTDCPTAEESEVHASLSEYYPGWEQWT